MRVRTLLLAVLLSPLAAPAQQTTLAPTPPMGWNSWDSYGFFISEPDFRASAQWVARELKPFGYEYVTIDEGWYESLPAAGQKDGELHLDDHGRFIPALDRFPSAADGKGLAPLADYIHSLGLKFGIHVLQGIPRKAVDANSPILNTTLFAKNAANTHATCQWDDKMYDLQVNPAAQAYYDSIVQLYASWNVDFLKVDCISSRPYKGDEIRMFHQAIVKSGRPMVLSLSPGAAPLDEAENMQRYSQMWRIEDDTWDVWSSGGRNFPQGIDEHFAVLRAWLPYAGPGHWPDPDMLPIGPLSPSPGWGKPRNTELTPDEQSTMMNLWAISRSPLIYGGDPLHTDAATLKLLTNKAVIAVDQHSRDTKNPILTESLAVWTAKPETGNGYYVAVFNRKDQQQNVSLAWTDLGLPAGTYATKDLLKPSGDANLRTLKLTLPAHGSAMMLVHAGR